MRVLATADLHGSLPEVEPCDLLLIAGDICPDYVSFSYGHDVKLDKGEQKQLNWLRNEFRDWLYDIPADYVVGIAGNHDFVFEHEFLVKDVDLPWQYLKDTSASLPEFGLHVYGTPWVPNLSRWAFYGSDAALLARAESIPTDVDILISHGPPRGYGDVVNERFGGGHAGDVYLANELDRIEAGVVICGHIHEGYGAYQHNDTPIYNVALNTMDYDPTNPVVELEEFA